MSYEETECTPYDCMCSGLYDNPYDNYYYSHKLNPALQYMFWIQEWKKQHWEIHQACKELGTASHSDEYVKGFIDGVSVQPPISVSLNTDRMEEEADKFVRELMSLNQGTSLKPNITSV